MRVGVAGGPGSRFIAYDPRSWGSDAGWVVVASQATRSKAGEQSSNKPMSLAGVEERAVHFDCVGERLQGVLSAPTQPQPRKVGVLVVVGGPQYRAGSHRQFVLLARRLAAAGWPVLRFDVRGMGDSTGDLVSFESSGPDIAAGVRALRQASPGVERVVLWGLCDAATAALLEVSALPDVAGLVLLNPWARHAETMARVHLKRHYLQRLLEPAFWHKLASGRVALRPAAVDLVATVRRVARSRAPALRQSDSSEPIDFRQRLALALMSFQRPALVVLSGRDYVAAEFLEFSASRPALAGLWSRANIQRLDVPEADHTFSNQALRTAVEDATFGWLASEFPGGRA